MSCWSGEQLKGRDKVNWPGLLFFYCYKTLPKHNLKEEKNWTLQVIMETMAETQAGT